MIRLPSLLVLALAIAAVAATSAACTGENGGGYDDDDDDDDAQTTPGAADACTIVWASSDPVLGGTLDLFFIDGPRSAWETGNVEYSVGTVLGLLYNETPFPTTHVPTPTAASAAVTTNGTFALDLADGLAEGGVLSMLDEPGQELFSLDLGSGTIGGRVGTGLSMSFDGVWSDSDPDAPLTNGTPGSIANVAYLTSNLTLGTYARYAVCYSVTTAATSEQRVALMLERMAREFEGRTP